MISPLASPGRRGFLQHSGMGLGALGLTSLMAEESIKAPGLDHRHFPGKARHVIHFFLNGGPSHVDTFDHKPALSRLAGKTLPPNLLTERKTGSAMPSPFRFRNYGESGLLVSDLFERTARHADKLAVIRSMYAEVPNHEPSLMLMNCGDSVQSRPSVGAWTLYGLGSENQNLPGFLAMCPGGLPIKDSENWQAGFLPGNCQGTWIDTQHTQVSKLIENINHPQISTADQSRQLALLRQLNMNHRESRSDDRLEARIRSFELAFRMQRDADEAFDVSQEPAHIQQLYGDGVHARQTLIARRLIERGVRYVQLWHGAGQPWDNHANIESAHSNLSRQIDQPIAALLSDLEQRGLLEETLIIWGGEFGRTPTVELAADGRPQSGRDHNHWGFTVWMAGAGIRGGSVYGATDELGFRAAENPVSVHDLHATILHCLGFDHRQLTFRYAGRDFRLTDVHGNVIAPICT